LEGFAPPILLKGDPVYIIGQNPLQFINPLQVESIKYDEETLVLNAAGTGAARAVIKMASGEEFIIDKEAARGTSIDEAIKKLVFQIDLANGLVITDKGGVTPESQAEDERKGNT